MSSGAGAAEGPGAGIRNRQGTVSRRRLLALALAALAAPACSTSETLRGATMAPPPERLGDDARYASIVIDAQTGRVLHSINADQPRYPASLTKMMTLYMLFEAIEDGRVSRGAEIPVSAYAAGRPPSRLGLRAGETIDVDTAIRALVVKSANDVAAAVAEHLAGSEGAFAAAMTAKARQIGMAGTVFRNASGLPDPDQRTTARDMAVLGLALRRRFPGQYAYFSGQSFVFRGRQVRGHNKVLETLPGADGIKTGYIRASGFNLVTSVSRDGRRIVAVVMGGATADQRNAHMEMLVERYLPAAARR